MLITVFKVFCVQTYIHSRSHSVCFSERGRAVAELERPLPRPGRLPGRHHQHPLPAQINGRVFGTPGSAGAPQYSNLLHWLGDISAGPECTVDFFCFVFWFVLFLNCICCIMFFFLSLWGGVSCSKWLKCMSVWGHVKGEKCFCASLDLWSCEAQSGGHLFIFRKEKCFSDHPEGLGT